jgi:hypothetical protein
VIRTTGSAAVAAVVHRHGSHSRSCGSSAWFDAGGISSAFKFSLFFVPNKGIAVYLLALSLVPCNKLLRKSESNVIAEPMVLNQNDDREFISAPKENIN